MATRGDLITRLMKELHLDGTSYTAEAVNAIDSAVAFYRGERFWFNEGVTEFVLATASTITLSSSLPDSVSIDSVRATDASGSRYVLTPENLADFNAHATTTAEPERYAVHAAQLHLWPVNNATRTIEVRWSGRVTMTASNSSSCVWTNEAEELVRMHATIDLCENFLLDLPRADRARAREGQVLGRLLAETVSRLGSGNLTSYW